MYSDENGVTNSFDNLVILSTDGDMDVALTVKEIKALETSDVKVEVSSSGDDDKCYGVTEACASLSRAM